MTFTRVDIWQLNSSRPDDLKEAVAGISAERDRVKMDAVHLAQMGEGADQPNLYYTFVSWQDAASYGASIDLAIDEQWQAIVGTLFRENPTAAHLRTILLDEVVGSPEIANPPANAVRLVRGWQVKPGREAEVVAAVREMASAIAPFGASVALYRTVVGGTLQSSYYTVGQFPNGASLGRYLDTLARESAVRKIFAPVVAADGPAATVLTRIDYVIF